jgi:alpha-N-arabinofuranosidase
MKRQTRAIGGGVAVTVALTLAPLAASAGGSMGAEAATAAATSITLDPAKLGNVINPDLFGVNHRYGYEGFGMWDPATQQPYPAFTQQVSDADFGAIRYPGGTIANRFDWKASIGPLAQRKPSPHGGTIGEPLTADFGPDEYGRFLEQTGAVGSIVVNFGTANAADAADWVEYMTAPVGANPRGGTAWADVRAANGHPAPYDIPYWEVGNEPNFTQQSYWRAGTSTLSPAQLYADGGSTQFTKQRAARDGDYRTSAAVSTGAAGQQFLVQYAPVTAGSATVYVGSTAWQRVSSLSGAGANPVYVLDDATGRITFGDGTNGGIPTSGSVVSISYTSGPHDGFVDFYREMKEADPSAKVCLGASDTAYIDAMGANGVYDCAVFHSYVTSSTVPGGTPTSDFRSRFLSKPDDMVYYINRAAQYIQTVRGTAPGEVPIVVTEYGHLGDSNANPSDAPHYHRSLDEGLYDAEFLRNLIQLGTVPLAMRHALVDYQFADAPAGSLNVGTPDDGMIGGPGPDTVPQGQALVYQLFGPMHGQQTVGTTVAGSPVIAASGGDSMSALTALASTDQQGNIVLLVINRSADQDIAADVLPKGYVHSADATVRVVNGDGPAAYNTPEDRDAVALTESVRSVGTGNFTHTFPAHSVTSIALSHPAQVLFGDDYGADTIGQPPAGYTVSGPIGAASVTSDVGGDKVLTLQRTAPGSQLISAVRPMAATSDDLEFFARVRAAQANAALGLQLLDGSGQPVARVSLAANGRLSYTTGSVFVDTPTTYPTGAWVDLDIRVDAATGTYRLGVNGATIVDNATLERPLASAAQVRAQIPTTSASPSRFDIDQMWSFRP